MKCRILVGLACLGLLYFVPIQTAQAQRQYRRYSPPAGPTLTPYLNLTRGDTGIVGDAYNAFVLPRRQLDKQLYNMETQQRSDAQANRAGIEKLREAEAAPTGTGATYMNYSHYYSMPRNNSNNGGGRRR